MFTHGLRVKGLIRHMSLQGRGDARWGEPAARLARKLSTGDGSRIVVASPSCLILTDVDTLA